MMPDSEFRKLVRDMRVEQKAFFLERETSHRARRLANAKALEKKVDDALFGDDGDPRFVEGNCSNCGDELSDYEDGRYSGLCADCAEDEGVCDIDG